jgi:hypothetical protein
MSNDANPRRVGRRAVEIDVSGLVPADLSVVEALARLQLAALRCGFRLQLHGADGGLVELLDLVGLGDVLRGGQGSP